MLVTRPTAKQTVLLLLLLLLVYPTDSIQLSLAHPWLTMMPHKPMLIIMKPRKPLLAKYGQAGCGGEAVVAYEAGVG